MAGPVTVPGRYAGSGGFAATSDLSTNAALLPSQVAQANGLLANLNWRGRLTSEPGPPLVSFRAGSGSAATSAFTNVSSQGLALSSSIVAGDLVLVAVAVSGTGTSGLNTVSLSGGGVTWASCGTFQLGGGSAFGTTVTLAVFQALAVYATIGATVTATIGTAGQCTIAAAAYPGGQGVDVYATGADVTGSTTMAEPSGTTGAGSEMLVGIMALWTASTATVTTSLPADTPFLRTHTGDTDFQWLGIADSGPSQLTPGAAGGGSYTWTGSAAGCVALISITPATVVPSAVPYVVGQAGAGVSTLAIPVIRNMSSGDQIGVWASSMSGTVSAVTDSRGNSYTFVSLQTTSNNSYYYQAEGTPTPLQVGDTVFVTRSGATNYLNGHIIGLPGLAASPVDAAKTTSSGTSASPSATTGTLAQASEFVLAMIENASGGGVPAYAGGWTISDSVQGGAGGSFTSWAYQAVSATTAVTASATITSAAWEIIVVPVEQASSSFTSGSTMSGSGTLGASPYFDGTGTTLSGQGTLGASPIFQAAGGMSGVGSLAAGPVFQAAAALSGQGSLTAPETIGTHATLSGAGTLTSLPVLAGSAALTGLGTLAGVPVRPSSATMTGLGSLTAGAQLAASATLSGAGTLQTASQLLAAAALSGTGTLSAASQLAGAAALIGSGTLSVGGLIIGTHAVLTGSGSLAASPVYTGAAVLSGLGSLTALPVFAGTGALSGLGSLSTAPILVLSGNLSGLGTLGTVPVLSAAAALSGSGTLTGPWTFGDLSAMSGLGTLSGAYSGLATQGSATLTGQGALAAAAFLASSAALSGQGTLTGGAQLRGAGVLSGLGALAGAPFLRVSGTLSGLGSLAAAPVLAAAATLSGTGILAASYRIATVALLSGQGSMASTYVLGYQAAAMLAGIGSLAASWQVQQPATGSALLSGLGTLLASPTVTGGGDTGTVDWTAAPAAERWLAVPGTDRWMAGPALPRWYAALTSQIWHAAPAPPRWEIIMATFEPVSALSLEEINVTWTSDLDGTTIDPIAGNLTVQFAVPVSSGNVNAPAQPVTWYPASWLHNGVGKGYVAQGLVGPSAGTIVLVAGTSYDVWGRILGSPEQPTKFVGVQSVY